MEAQLTSAAITAYGTHFPDWVVPNRYFYEDLGLDTSEEWIRTRTGVEERRLVKMEHGETCASLATDAAWKCLDQRGLDPKDLDAIILATISPDLGYPATACLVQDRLGAKNAFAFDLSGACTGFLYALVTGSGMIECGRSERVLVIGAEAMSTILDYQDRNTAILFGDGAGAALLEPSTTDAHGKILDSILRTDGSGARFLYRTGGGSLALTDVMKDLFPPSEKTYQEGRAVFKYAVQNMTAVVEELLARNGLNIEDVDVMVPHQANRRIIEAVGNKLGMPADKTALYVNRYGNTTAATLPTAMALHADAGKIKEGDLVLFCTFGAGFTWGAGLVRWGRVPVGPKAEGGEESRVGKSVSSAEIAQPASR